MSDQWIKFSPAWAPHVHGEYTERVVDPETNQFQEQVWKVVCTICKSSWGPVKCQSGLTRKHIATFAVSHMHRNVLMDPTRPK